MQSQNQTGTTTIEWPRKVTEVKLPFYKERVFPETISGSNVFARFPAGVMCVSGIFFSWL